MGAGRGGPPARPHRRCPSAHASHPTRAPSSVQAGYTNLVGLKGGFYAWYRVFDFGGRRRRSGEYAEQVRRGLPPCWLGAGCWAAAAVEVVLAAAALQAVGGWVRPWCGARQPGRRCSACM